MSENQNDEFANRNLLLTAALQVENGELAGASEICFQTIAADPGNAEAWNLLGVVRERLGELSTAIQAIEQAIRLSPSVPAFHNALGVILARVGKSDEAVQAFQTAIALNSKYVIAHQNLGRAYFEMDNHASAAQSFEQVIRLAPNEADAHNALANSLSAMGQLTDAIKCNRRAISLKKDYSAAYNNLAHGLGEQGRADLAIDCFVKVVELSPQSAHGHSDLVFALHYTPKWSPKAIFEEHRRWAERHAKPIADDGCSHFNNRNPDRRLKIGYVSTDFREHPVSRFLEPILRHHDRRGFEVSCYADVTKPDVATAHLRSLSDRWVNITGLSDHQLAEQIRKDQIDLLVDLNGHMGKHRLLVFARKPAPVQVTYLGYPDTTGLPAIDYRFTDSLHDPIGEADQYHSEQLIRLDPCCWAYQTDEQDPAVNELPALKAGHVTFASMNRLWKITPQVANTWARILNSMPSSRLIFLVRHPRYVDPGLYQVFEQAGISRDRLIPINSVKRTAYLSQYHQADIALDPFPYNGHTTTIDAIWMGVPVVTLAGNTHVSRAGISVLTNVGLSDLITQSTDDYISRAITLANDLNALAGLRRSLRDRLNQSPLLDHVGLTRRIEEQYRKMWHRWCNGNRSSA